MTQQELRDEVRQQLRLYNGLDAGVDGTEVFLDEVMELVEEYKESQNE